MNVCVWGEEMIGRARYQNIYTELLKKVNKHSSSLYGFLLRKLIEHYFFSVYKSSKYAMLHTKFTVLVYIMKCAFIEQKHL